MGVIKLFVREKWVVALGAPNPNPSFEDRSCKLDHGLQCLLIIGTI